LILKHHDRLLIDELTMFKRQYIIKIFADFERIIAIGEKQGRAEIGFVVVDEISRGRHIGFDLVNQADSVAYELGFSKKQVMTQLKNRIACQFYQKCQFSVDKTTNIYHYWR